MVIYHGPEKTCAVAFSGSNDETDWAQNLDLEKIDGCGISQVHRGFYNEMKSFLDDEKWTNVAAGLQGEQCRNAVYAVGHSLGGGAATNFAACANAEASGTQTGFNLPFRGVLGLYTFGAPATSKVQMQNPLATTGIFPGVRHYNHDKFGHDGVAAVAGVMGFVHPKLQAVRLSKPLYDPSYTEYYTHPGGSACAKNYPMNTFFSMPSPIALHSMTVYEDRCKVVYTDKSAISVPSGCGSS